MSDQMDRADSFPETRWSLVAQAAGASLQAKRQAMAELLARYRPAFMKFLVVTKRTNPDLAEDLVQGFMATKILGRDLIAKAEKAKGKLRSFLCRALQNYMIDQLRSRHGEHVDINERLDAARTQASADEFHLAWARQVMDETYRRMCLHCETTGRMGVWRVFRCRVVDPTRNGAAPPSSKALAEKLGFESPKQVDNSFVSAKRMFERFLREIISEYAPREDVGAEIDDLMSILASARNT